MRWAATLAAFALTSCSDPRSGYRPPAPPTDAPLAAEVDPFIGTAGETPHDGQTFPGAVVPWGRRVRFGNRSIAGRGATYDPALSWSKRGD